MCESVDPTLCKLRCEKALAKHPACAAEAKAVTDCAATTGCWTCPVDELHLTGCDAERKTYELCSACLHTPGESLCGYCGKEKCCAEGKAILQTKDGLGFADCLDLCNGNPACTAGCKSAFPDAAKATDAYLACLGTPCPAACGVSSSGTDVLREYCKSTIAVCKLGTTQSDCEKNTRQAAASFGCGEYLWKQMECDLAKGIKCDTTTGYPVSDPTCAAIVDSCPHTMCINVSSPDGSCTEGCGDWKAQCQPGGTSCECIFGKNKGKKFTLGAACDSNAMELACSI